MQQFELRFFDRLNVAILARALIARDDLAALEEAESLSRTHAIEVWQGERFVARVKRNKAALNERDRASL